MGGGANLKVTYTVHSALARRTRDIGAVFDRGHLLTVHVIQRFQFYSRIAPRPKDR